MTLVSLPSPIAWPGILGNVNGGPSLSNSATLSASGHYMAYAFVAKEDMTVSHVGFRAGTVANAPTIDVRIETLDPTTGLPSGTLWATNTNATSGVISSNTNPLVALTDPATITRGQVFCVKIVWGGVATSTIVIQHLASVTTLFNSCLPYQITNTGSPSKSFLNSLSLLIALGSSSTTFYQVPGTIPLSAYSGGTFNNTNSAKRGLKFTPPMNCRAIGIRWYNSSAVGDFNAGLYTGDASGTELSSSSTAFEGDNTAASANGALSVFFDSPVSLTAGTAYRVAIEPSSSTNCNVSVYTLPTSDYFGAMPSGATAVYSSLVSGTWTDSTTQIPLMDVLIDQVDNGAGSGGVVGVIGG